MKLGRLKGKAQEASEQGHEEAAMDLIRKMVELKKADQQDDKGRSVAMDIGRVG